MVKWRLDSTSSVDNSGRWRDQVNRVDMAELTKANIEIGLDFLAERDDDLAKLYRRYGVPPLWSREPGFATLVQIVLEQQVSLASARAVFTRLNDAVPVLTPGSFLALGEDLKRFGFSRQKARYCRELAQRVNEGLLDLKSLEQLDDDSVRKRLTEVRGIGRWTAEIYLLMALNRPDAWPAGDLAVAKAVQQIKGLKEVPQGGELEEISEGWRPWRALAARLLWQHYLKGMSA